MNPRSTLLVFTRVPQLGNVKQRLAADIGDEAALAFHRAATAHAIAVGVESPVVERRLCIDGDFVGDPFNADAAGYTLHRQIGMDLGEKMFRAFDDAFLVGADAVVIIGTDVPDVSVRTVTDAFEVLETHDAVVGPAADGGYYLLGLRAPHATLFSGIAWGTTTVLGATRHALEKAGLLWWELDTLADIDTAADLRAWRAAHPGSIIDRAVRAAMGAHGARIP